MNKSAIYTATTNEISVSVVATYEPDVDVQGPPSNVFSYSVTIMNQSQRTVQLLSRKWYILDLMNGHHRVEGDGVVGEQPILKKDDTYIYSSWCPIKSEIGYMEGTYLFVDIDTGEKFNVVIPRFELIVGNLKN